MSLHTTFRVGGPAELYLRPRDQKELLELTVLLADYSAEELPRFYLGGGANIVVSDDGMENLVVEGIHFVAALPASRCPELLAIPWAELWRSLFTVVRPVWVNRFLTKWMPIWPKR